MNTNKYIAQIAALEAENGRLRGELSVLPVLVAENLAMKDEVATMKETIIELVKKIEQLSIKKDSSNSHKPPSSDIYSKNRSLRVQSGRKAGGQQGHKGSTLQMRTEVSRTEPLIPIVCTVCEHLLDRSKAVLLERRQVVDVPPIYPEVIEYQAYGIPCTCGHHQVAPFPPGVDNHIQYGPNVAALTVYHNVYQYVPFKRLQHFFTHVCHLPLSIGTLENIVSRMANKARPIWEGYQQALQDASAIGGDETSAKVNGKKQWIWVWQSALITFLAVSTSRGNAIVEKLFPNGFPLATFCSDRWKAQLKTQAQKHQICIAHLLRELIYIIQIENTDWAKKFKELLLKTIKLKQENDAYPQNHELTRQIETQLDELLKEEISDKYADKTRTFKNSMSKYRTAILPFLYDHEVNFDNNASERSIRNVKVKLKVSGQFKSGHEDYCILRSIIDTTIKTGQSVLGTIATITHMTSPPKAAV